MKILSQIKVILCLSGLILISCAAERQPGRIAVLAEITDPDNNMRTTEDRLFVANSTDSLQMRTTVMVYSLEDGRLVNKFGGPGVFRIQPAHGVFLFMQPDRFAVNSSGKVSIYNYNFELLQELEHGGDSFFYVPIGDNFIARQIYSENRINYYRLNLYDHELNIIKELCRKEFAGRAFTGDFSFEVYQDKVYVSKERDDFHIEVFDKEGNIVNSITHDCSRVKVTQDQKDKHMSNLTNRPGWERYFKSRDEMEEYFRNLIKYPEYFPAIEGIHLSDDKIYVLTRLQVEGKREFWILDPDGNAIDKIMIPFKMRSENMQYPYSIRNNHLYQLILNEQTEKWELFSTRIQ